MVKVLIYALNYAPETVGVGRYTGDIGAYLAEQGHRVTVITALPHYPEWRIPAGYPRFAYRRETRAGAKVIYCPLVLRHPMRGLWRVLAPASFALTSLPVLVWTMLRRRPDVIFCVEPTLFAAPAALALSWLTRARTILHVQDLEIDAAFAVGHLKGGILQRAAVACENAVLRGFGQIITVSNRMRAAILRKGVRPDRVAMVRNWVDLDAIKPLTGRNAYREEFGWPDALVIGLYAGSIGAKQDLHVLLDAAQQLADRSDILFVIAGDGPAKPALVKRYGTLPNVCFLPPQPEARMCELLNLPNLHLLPQAKGIADLVLPSKLGGMLASGRTVLVTADEGTELFEVLQGTAIVVPAGDVHRIAREFVTYAAGWRQNPLCGDRMRLTTQMSRTLCLQIIETLLQEHQRR